MSGSSSDAERLLRARTLEAEGDVEGASRAYLEAGSLGEAARVLADARRYTDAASLLLRSLDRPLTHLAGITGRDRRVAEKAADCYALAGEHELAERIRSAIEGRPSRPPLSARPRAVREQGWRHPAGQVDAARARMIDELVAGGRLGAAARVAWEAEDFDRAARWFLELGSHYEAGMCLADMSDFDRALEQLVQVPLDHKYYRRAAARAIEAARHVGRFDFELDRFVSPFLWSPPRTDGEVSAYVIAARLYAKGGFDATAREVLERVAQHDPTHEETRALLERMSGQGSIGSLVPPPRPAARRADSLPDLPPLDGYVRASSTVSRTAAPRTRAPSQPPAPPAPAVPVVPPAASRSEPPARSPSPGPTEDPPVSPGSIVADRYRIVAQLGSGGMALVWRAHDTELGQDIALKVMHPEASELWLPRFRQELALARVLTHKNIVRVFDIGQHGASRFISMELLEGMALDEMFDQPIPLLDGLHYIVQVCAGLRVAHEHGIIHRDLKPSNFFVTESGLVKLTDFGVSKAPGSDSASERGLTQVGAIVGTPEYMSPEQIEDAASVTPASDVYSLGICLYEMYTLTCPFEHESRMQVLRMHHELPPPPPGDRNPHIPESMQAVILRCLAKEPAERFASATELARALRSVAQELR